MPQPTRYTRYVIGVTGGTQKAGDRCKLTNLEGRGTVTKEFKAGTECVLNPGDSELEWQVGDKIMAHISGRLVGSKEFTLTKGGAKVTVTTGTEDIIAVDL